jgi:hypothetical protein
MTIDDKGLLELTNNKEGHDEVPQVSDSSSSESLKDNSSRRVFGDSSGGTFISGISGDGAVVLQRDIALQRLAEITSRIDVKIPFFGFSWRRNSAVPPSLSSVQEELVRQERVTVRRDQVSLRREQVTILSELSKLGIDPVFFDLMLSNELDRNLKRQFGVLFLALTSVFTGISYLVIVLAGILEWKIPSIAITALIVETPLQFIGLLYIIARNLFPQLPIKKISDEQSKLANKLLPGRGKADGPRGKRSQQSQKN